MCLEFILYVFFEIENSFVFMFSFVLLSSVLIGIGKYNVLLSLFGLIFGVRWYNDFELF